MTKILLSGCHGRMGGAVISAAEENSRIKIISGVDISEGESSFPVYKAIHECGETPDVIVDFSHHTSLPAIMEYAVNNNVPAVIATTGHTDAELEIMKNAAEKIPVFFSRNMSIGVNLLIALSRKASEFLGVDYDVEIIEKHHRNKLDAPSGTALMIADAIKETRESTSYVYDRHERKEKRSSEEIGIHAVRGGSIIGEHEVIFAGKDEVIAISHSAASRSLFATGAIKAAEFIVGKPAGMYSMDDLLSGVI